MSARDANNKPIGVGDTVRRHDDILYEAYEQQPRCISYFVISLNEEPIFGSVVSTPDGPQQLIHSRIRVQDTWLYDADFLILAEEVVVTRKAPDTAKEA